jgi:hypothetical protein
MAGTAAVVAILVFIFSSTIRNYRLSRGIESISISGQKNSTV